MSVRERFSRGTLRRRKGVAVCGRVLTASNFPKLENEEPAALIAEGGARHRMVTWRNLLRWRGNGSGRRGRRGEAGQELRSATGARPFAIVKFRDCDSDLICPNPPRCIPIGNTWLQPLVLEPGRFKTDKERDIVCACVVSKASRRR